LAVLTKENEQKKLFKAHRLKISEDYFITWPWGLSEYCRQHMIGKPAGTVGDELICRRVDSSLLDRVLVNTLLHNPTQRFQHWIYTCQIHAKPGYVVRRDSQTGETVVVRDEN